MEKGYWLIVCQGRVNNGSVTEFNPQPNCMVSIKDADCPIKGHGTSQEEAMSTFLESYKFYRNNDPELVPELHNKSDHEPHDNGGIVYTFTPEEKLAS